MKYISPIHTGLYRLDIRKFNFDITHIYEHLLLRTFLSQLKASNFSLCLYGWMGGDTFNEVSFIRYGFYDPRVEKLFHDFMQSASRIDARYLEGALRGVAAEEKSLIQVDRKQLFVKLRAIDAAPWELVDRVTGAPSELMSAARHFDKEIIHLQKSAKSFRDVTVVASMEHPELLDIVAYQRVHTMVLDIIHSVVWDLGLYEREVSRSQYHKPSDTITTFGIFSMQRGGASIKDIKMAIVDTMQQFSLRGHEDELLCYRDALTAVASWSDFPVQYFRHSGILASRQQVAESLSLDRVEKIIHSLDIEVLPTHATHWERLGHPG